MGTHPIFESDFDCLTDGRIVPPSEMVQNGTERKRDKISVTEVGDARRHVRYFLQCLSILPGRFAYLDSQRLVLAHFALGGLSLLDGLGQLRNRDEIVEWIYSLQSDTGGFYGSDMMAKLPPDVAQTHIASTFSALQSLLILGDDLSRVKVNPLLSWLCELQTAEGSFCGAADNVEQADMRFSYCAAFVFHLFGGARQKIFSSSRVDSAVSFILRCQSPDSSFGQVPGSEGHGALTFCALAALKLFGRAHVLERAECERIARFCVNRQLKGIHGRPHKPDDSCYTFWTSAALKLASPSLLIGRQIDIGEVVSFCTSCCDDVIGGVAKYPGNPPDPTHSFLALAGIGVIGNDVIPEYMLNRGVTKELLKIRNAIQPLHHEYQSPMSIRSHYMGIFVSFVVAL